MGKKFIVEVDTDHITCEKLIRHLEHGMCDLEWLIPPKIKCKEVKVSKQKISEETLEDFLSYGCDGFEDIKVVRKNPLTLLFITWGSDRFLLEVNKIEKKREGET